jgi:hypothetical protein
MKRKIKKDYDPLLKKMIARKITASDFVMRHSHCVTVRQVLYDVERTHNPHVSYGLGIPHVKEGVDYTPKSLKAVCDFPNDGFCGKDPPSSEQLAVINMRLGGKLNDKGLLAYIKGEITIDELNQFLNGQATASQIKEVEEFFDDSSDINNPVEMSDDEIKNIQSAALGKTKARSTLVLGGDTKASDEKDLPIVPRKKLTLNLGD